MPQDIISKKTRYEFREYFVGIVLREIEAEFDAADVPFDKNYEPDLSGERRSLVEKYYHAVDWSKWKDVRKVLLVFENVLSELEDQINGAPFGDKEWAEHKSKALKKWIERDGFKYSEGKLIPVRGDHTLTEIADTTSHFDAPELHRQIDRMKASVEDDPCLAIGTAKELIETTCKTILSERGVVYKENLTITKLIKITRENLGLVPDNIPASAKGADTIRRVLSNMGMIAQGLSELRNLYGTGHGKKGKSKGLSPRHARLAVGAAATLATFLFETHEERDL